MTATLERARQAFEAALEQRVRKGSPLHQELTREADPVLDALASVRSVTNAHDDLEYREALTLVALFGRRAATLGMSPTGTLHLLDAFALSLEDASSVVRSVGMEGYVAAVEERSANATASRAALHVKPQRVARGVYLLWISGDHEESVLSGALDAAGLELLNADARACLVHVQGTIADEVLRTVLAFDGTARMLGVDCAFSGIEPSVSLDARHREILVVQNFEEGLRHALSRAGHDVRRARPWFASVRGMLARPR